MSSPHSSLVSLMENLPICDVVAEEQPEEQETCDV